MLLLRTNAASAPASSSASRGATVSIWKLNIFPNLEIFSLGSSCCGRQEQEAVELQQIEGDGISQGQVAINMEEEI